MRFKHFMPLFLCYSLLRAVHVSIRGVVNIWACKPKAACWLNFSGMQNKIIELYKA